MRKGIIYETGNSIDSIVRELNGRSLMPDVISAGTKYGEPYIMFTDGEKKVKDYKFVKISGESLSYINSKLNELKLKEFDVFIEGTFYNEMVVVIGAVIKEV